MDGFSRASSTAAATNTSALFGIYRWGWGFSTSQDFNGDIALIACFASSWTPAMVRRWHADPFGFLRPWNEVPALMGSAPPATPPSTRHRRGHLPHGVASNRRHDRLDQDRPGSPCSAEGRGLSRIRRDPARGARARPPGQMVRRARRQLPVGSAGARHRRRRRASPPPGWQFPLRPRSRPPSGWPCYLPATRFRGGNPDAAVRRPDTARRCRSMPRSARRRSPDSRALARGLCPAASPTRPASPQPCGVAAPPTSCRRCARDP